MALSCEVVAVGTELLLGQIVDTNSAWMGEHLAAAGIDSHYQVKVGDNQARIEAAIRAALARSDAVICCGGLGPTQDDITREAIAAVMGVPLERDPDMVASIATFFRGRGREMAANNERQADKPVGAAFIPQTMGTAPGLICPVDGKVIYAVPGVPHEMEDMLERAVIPDLRRRSGETAVIRSRVLRTWGLAESTLAEKVAHRFDRLEGIIGAPTIAFLASGPAGIKVRVTVKAADAATADRALDEEEAELRAVLGDVVFGVDDDTMESVVGTLLRKRGLTLGVAESLTGGLIGARLTEVPGASEWFRGSIVSYASDVKYTLLGVPDGPVVSASAAEAMALGAMRALGADVGLAVTGVAGPTEQDGMPVGTVFGAVHLDGTTSTHELHLPGDRERVRWYSTISLLDALRKRLLADAPG
ncbi:MAG TPA: competence/damage-inducible protein A [Acidimicrobiales bacterium]|nr:competence/damage-inducible protein A [Acidimicrobiales bacterium]